MTEPDNEPISLQEQFFPELRCFGCGPSNPKGLRLRSFASEDDESVRATFLPWPEHDNGLGYLNGGIIATVLDCHSAAAVIHRADLDGLVLDGSLPYVTAGLEVSYRRPSPLHEPVELIARVARATDTEMRVESELWWEDKLRAGATSLWRRWRRRT